MLLNWGGVLVLSTLLGDVLRGARIEIQERFLGQLSRRLDQKVLLGAFWCPRRMLQLIVLLLGDVLDRASGLLV